VPRYPRLAADGPTSACGTILSDRSPFGPGATPYEVTSAPQDAPVGATAATPSPARRHASRDQGATPGRVGPGAPLAAAATGPGSANGSLSLCATPGEHRAEAERGGPDLASPAGQEAFTAAAPAGMTPPASRRRSQAHSHSRHRLRPDPRAAPAADEAGAAHRAGGSPGGGDCRGRGALRHHTPAQQYVRYGGSSADGVQPFNYGSPARGGGGGSPGAGLLPNVMVADSTQFGGKLSLQGYARGACGAHVGGGRAGWGRRVFLEGARCMPRVLRCNRGTPIGLGECFSQAAAANEGVSAPGLGGGACSAP
jgi:hypothetical protein